MTLRQERINSVIHRGVQSVLAEGLNDPRLDGCVVTVTRVSVDKPMTTATIMVSVLPQASQNLAIAALRSAAKHVRRHTADRVNIHRMPRFNFKLDTSAKRQLGVLEALAKVRAETEANPPTPAPDHADIHRHAPTHNHTPEQHDPTAEDQSS